MEPINPVRKVSGGVGSINRIGTGTLGGKANGLIFIEETLRSKFDAERFLKISVGIPRMTVIAADFFTAFMEQNDLHSIAYSDLPDDRIAHAFLKADLPAELVGDLRSIASQVRVPLAVRSSSLLEDALYRPFAGVYATKMIPNNQPDVDTRYRKLVEAIKFVYASTFFKNAKKYIQSIDEDPRAEKMAVIIQEMVGQQFGDRFYPNLSGVARSFNFYPYGHAQPEDGVVDLALGLGKTVVDGGQVWSYCPTFPKSPPPYNNTCDILKNTQTEFWAVNMGKPPAYDPIRETEYMVQHGLSEADYDSTLRFVASTYKPSSDRIVPGVGSDGPRVIDFAPILVLNDIPLNYLVGELLVACEEALKTDVEIEFAMTFSRDGGLPAQLGFLQVRPMVVSSESMDIPLERLDENDVLVATEKALGNSRREDIEDIVYVRPSTFDTKSTNLIADELEKINSSLGRERRPYLLIGFGRWGTSDPWRGIPVTWDQVSWARVIVEAQIPGVQTDMSQGSHFFHNLTSFKVSYFSFPQRGKHDIDFNWLRSQREITKTSFVRHVRSAHPLSIRVDGRSGRGIILRHGG
ncbi:MAG: hypothetical protein GY854_14895 [Deltaproteobacteria bacterium]|nr:hypothetical protein [Deltaproteobacteria bacterium]